METALVILSVGLLIFLGHFFGALFERTRIPDVLPLLLLGLIIGPLLHFVTPEAFGKVGGIFTVVALIVILFQSGLDLKLGDLRRSMATGLGLTLAGYFLTVAAVGAIGFWGMGLAPVEALVLGSILGGTSSAVVIPILEKVTLGDKARTSLLLESTFSDVICIVGTLGLLQSTQQSHLKPGAMVGNLLAAFLLACLIGTLGALAWSFLLDRVRRLENSTFLTPAFVFILYGLAELLGYSGAIAALAFGVMLGNGPQLPLLKKFQSVKPLTLNATEKAFLAEIVFVVKTFFFAYIGLSLRFGEALLILGAFLVTLALFALRVLIVNLALTKSGNDRWDATVASVMNPKGLAAAVLAGMPLEWGLAGGMTIQSVVYSVVLFTILGTALLIPALSWGPMQKAYGLFLSAFPAALRKDPAGPSA